MVDYRVALGDVLSVDYAVENQGETVGDQDIELLVASTQEDSDTGVVVDVGVTETGTLEWDTTGATAQEYTVSVESADTSDQFTLEVVDPTNTAFYLVDIDSTNSPILDKNTLDVTATIENVGDQSGTQDITLNIDGAQEDSITGKSLAAGASETVELNWDAPSGSAGDKTATVNSADDFDDVTITVEQGSGFEVTIDQTNEPVVAGDTLTVQATIENTGLSQDTQFITLEIDNSVGTVDSTDVTLAPDSAKTVVLEWDTSDGDGGTTYTATVASLDDSDTASAEIIASDPDAPVSEVVYNVSLSGTLSSISENGSEVAVSNISGDLVILNSDTGAVKNTISYGDDSSYHALSDDYIAIYRRAAQEFVYYDRDANQVAGTRSSVADNPNTITGNIAIEQDEDADAFRAIDAGAFNDPERPVVLNSVSVGNGEGSASFNNGSVLLDDLNNGQVYNSDLSNKQGDTGLGGNNLELAGGYGLVAIGSTVVDDTGATVYQFNTGGRGIGLSDGYYCAETDGDLFVSSFDKTEQGTATDNISSNSHSVEATRDKVIYLTDNDTVKMRYIG